MTFALAYLVYPIPLDSGNLTALDLQVINSEWQLLFTRVRHMSPGKVDTPKPRCIGELLHGSERNIQVDWLIDWTHVRALNARGRIFQRDACYGFLLLIFGTVLFPNTSTLINGALAQVILQVIESLSYVEALVVETMWLVGHIRPFWSYHPFLNLVDAHPFEVYNRRNKFDWKRFMQQLTPEQNSWSAQWNPSAPMAIGCPSVIGLPLISHSECTLIFPDRVTRQLGGLQDIPVEGNRDPYQIVWADSAPSASERFMRIRLIHQLWDTHLMQDLHFPEHPTDEERAYSATSTYVARFHLQDPTSILRVPIAPLEAESSDQAARRRELQSLRDEIDRLHREIAEAGTDLIE
ncbi:hypothetical protein CRG98_045217 [Punica granatum]|uniref:Uncharacterized protein n=1 Tax=Punica granatum TaxID=22663 RepID=A0A2I0HT01_PUNGR|nr:hypothetical protein CRG98_045217 [Punica granatum]